MLATSTSQQAALDSTSSAICMSVCRMLTRKFSLIMIASVHFFSKGCWQYFKSYFQDRKFETLMWEQVQSTQKCGGNTYYAPFLFLHRKEYLEQGGYAQKTYFRTITKGWFYWFHLLLCMQAREAESFFQASQLQRRKRRHFAHLLIFYCNPIALI